MFKFVLTIIIGLLLIGCGKEQGVTARLHEPTEPTPKLVSDNAYRALNLSQNAQFKQDGSSLSSQAIRKDTLGFHMESKPANNDSTHIKIQHFQGLDANKCRNTVQEATINNSDLTKLTTIKTASVMCQDSKCKYILLVMYTSSSSYVDGNGKLVGAYVPVILKTEDAVGGPRRYIPMNSQDPFMTFKQNTRCNHVDETVFEQEQMVISPVDETRPSYNYSPGQGNNTWVYN